MDTRVAQRETAGTVPTDTFAARLKLARHHAGDLSIREAADKCGLGRGAWTNWEKGARPLDKDEISEIIAEQLGVDLDWLRYGGPLAAEVRRRRDRVITPPSSHGTRTATTRHLTSAAAHRTGPQTGHGLVIRRTPKEADTRPRWTHGR